MAFKQRPSGGKARQGGAWKGYQRRDPDTWRARARETAGNFDSYIKGQVKRYAARDESNKIRILPPTWENADDWSYPIYVHYGIGADEQTYLCPKAMKRSRRCPICEEADRLARGGDQEDAKRMKPKRRSGCWLIDRKDESAGPQFWAMPFSLARDANVAAEDEDGEILELDHPEKGYDLMFTKTGSRDRTKYSGVKLSRKPSSLAEDPVDLETWLEFVANNPVPDMLQFYDEEHLEQVFSGKISKRDDEAEEEDEDEDEAPRRSNAKKAKPSAKKYDDDEEEDDEPPLDEDEDEDEAPRRASKSEPEDDEDEDEDEDEAPKPRRKLTKALDEDEDEDEPDDDEDDEDEDEDEDDGRSSATRRLERASEKARARRK